MRTRVQMAVAVLAATMLAACGAETVTSSAPETVLPRSSHSYSPANPQVVISQIYGGGGNSGATLRSDFIELHNRGTTAVSVAGWSVQYASATGSTWTRTNIASGSIAPGGFFLVKQADGASGTQTLPAPDAIGTIAMSATAGKVVLVSDQATLSGSCPTGITVIDRVGFGTTANCTTEWGSNTPATSNTVAVLRGGDGCSYTGQAGADFVTGAPSPRNGAATAVVCGHSGDIGPVASVTLTPATSTIAFAATRQLTAVGRDANGNVVSAATFEWASSDIAVATVSSAGLVTGVSPGTATITATSGSFSGTATVTVSEPATLPSVRFTEIHYDNSGDDFGEALEIEGPAGTDLTGWRVILYNGRDGAAYDARPLSGAFASQCSGRGVMVLEYTTSFLQNGPDAMALVNAAGDVVEFLSYEGAILATNGPAAGMTSRNIGASQNGAAVNTSLQRSLSDTWSSAEDNFGVCNGRGTRTPRTTLSFGFRTPFDAALPVGFEDLLTVTRRLDGVVQDYDTPLVSETPAIAEVLANNVIRGLSAGTARFRATAPNGFSLTFELPIAVATVGTAAYANHVEFGLPTDKSPADDFVFTRDQSVFSYSNVRNTSNWVSYNLEATHVGAQERCDCFTFDPALPTSFTRYSTFDYVGSGYSRGHLVKSQDRTSGMLDNARTFYFTNIVPQTTENNSGPWLALENYLTDKARNENKEIFIVTGVAGSLGTLNDRGVVTIPGSLWKVAVVLPRDKGLADVNAGLVPDEVIAVIMPNSATMPYADWRGYATTVDAVEALSGYDMLSLLNDQIEIALESNTKPPVAMINGPFEILAGETVALSAAGSTDPDDGDALSYFWHFGDGTNASGLTATHRYVTPGNYLVRLTVRDSRELLDDATTTVMVLTDAGAVERAAARVDALGNTGRLNRGVANSLAAKLRAAAASVSRVSVQSATGQLQALVYEIDALVQARQLTESDAAPVRVLLERVVTSLNR